MVHSFRQKPLGWRYDSHRHYLAAKGISSRVNNKYFVRHDLKGNRAPPVYKSGYAQGKTKEQVDAELMARGIPIWNPPNKKEKIFESTGVSPVIAPVQKEDVYIPPSIEVEPLVPESTPEEESLPNFYTTSLRVGRESNDRKKSESTGPMTPGISPFGGVDFERGPV
jgi:hypothetical protein